MTAATMYMEAFEKQASEATEICKKAIDAEWNTTAVDDILDEIEDGEVASLKKMGEMLQNLFPSIEDDINDLYWIAVWDIAKHLMARMPEILELHRTTLLEDIDREGWDEDRAYEEAEDINTIILNLVDRIMTLVGFDPEDEDEYNENPLFEAFWPWFDEDTIFAVVEKRFAA